VLGLVSVGMSEPVLGWRVRSDGSREPRTVTPYDTAAPAETHPAKPLPDTATSTDTSPSTDADTVTSTDTEALLPLLSPRPIRSVPSPQPG